MQIKCIIILYRKFNLPGNIFFPLSVRFSTVKYCRKPEQVNYYSHSMFTFLHTQKSI